MRTEIIAAGVIVASAVVGVRYFETAQADVELAAVSPAEETTAPQMAPAFTGWPGEVRVSASHDKQFYIDANVNQRAAKFLIDTGASYVALRDTDARNAGVYTTWADYTYPVRTANGETKAAYVTLDEIEIEGIRVESVKAFILPDDQLAINLLGMSFLSRIDSVEARQGELVLRG